MPTAALSAQLPATARRRSGYFWSAALGWPLVWDQDQETAIRSPHGGPKITWGGEPPTPKTHKDRLRFELAPAVDSDTQAELDRPRNAGRHPAGNRATRRRATGVRLAVMADPDGREFWVH